MLPDCVTMFLHHTDIVQFLNEQQEMVHIIDQYIKPILLDHQENSDSNAYRDFVMHHLFANIRNSYQDGIFISQGLMSNPPYYISTALAHARRSMQEFLIDLAYIMSNIKHTRGSEYLRYLKYMLTTESEENKRLGRDNTANEDFIKKIFPPDLELPKRKSQWTDTSRKEKIKKGLKKYKIELFDNPKSYPSHRLEFHSVLSSAAHGNDNTIYTFLRTKEENLPKLEADLTISIFSFDIDLASSLKCYIKLYLGQNKLYKEMVKSIPSKKSTPIKIRKP